MQIDPTLCFQTIWISDHNGAGEPVRQFDSVQLFLNGLAQFDLLDAAAITRSNGTASGPVRELGHHPSRLLDKPFYPLW